LIRLSFFSKWSTTAPLLLKGLASFFKMSAPRLPALFPESKNQTAAPPCKKTWRPFDVQQGLSMRAEHSRERRCAQPHATAIHAELIGADAINAAGMVTYSTAPVLALCRALVAAGYDPATPLQTYRGATLCLRVRSIGEAAGLEVNAKGTAFIPHRAVRTASPMRHSRPAATGHRADRRAAP
jgi:hypothetical protein